MFAVYAKCPSRWRRGFGYNLNSHVVHKKGGGGEGFPTVQRGEKGWTLKAVLMLSTESISEIHYHIWTIVLPIYSPMFWSFVAR